MAYCFLMLCYGQPSGVASQQRCVYMFPMYMPSGTWTSRANNIKSWLVYIYIYI